MQDVIFYTIWSFVFCIMIWLVFLVAKSSNYKKGYDDGWNDRSRRSVDRIKRTGVNNGKHKSEV